MSLFRKKLLMCVLSIILSSNYANASVGIELIDALASLTGNIAKEEGYQSIGIHDEKDFSETLLNSTADEIASVIAKYMAINFSENAISQGTKQLPEFLRKKYLSERIKYAIKKKSLSKLGNLKASGIDLLVGVAIDVTAEVVKQKLGADTLRGQYTALAIEQAKVAWAAKKGMHYAVLESALIAGDKVFEVVKLHNELKKIEDDNEIQQVITDATQKALELRDDYKRAHKNQKTNVEQRIRDDMKTALIIKGGIFSNEKSIPGAEQYIDNYISTLKSADKKKYDVVERFRLEIINNADNPDVAKAYKDKALLFIDKNFYRASPFGPNEFNSNNEAASFSYVIDSTYNDVFVVKEPQPDFSKNNFMQNQLSAITQGGSSRIGTASYFIGRPPVQDRISASHDADAALLNQKYAIADLQGIRESSQYTDGQILSAPADILLGWGSNPSDLDSHLTGPVGDGSSTRFHTYYASPGSLDNSPNALLHSDYTNHGVGGQNLPEQTRINTLNEGVYRFYVHNYSGGSETALAESGATVTFHNAGSTSIVEGQGIGAEVARINVPTSGVGDTWQAFELDSRTGIINATTNFSDTSGGSSTVPFND